MALVKLEPLQTAGGKRIMSVSTGQVTRKYVHRGKNKLSKKMGGLRLISSKYSYGKFLRVPTTLNSFILYFV